MNPISQLERGRSLLRRLLQECESPLPLESLLIFINPEFTLYHVPRNPSIVFRIQLDRFMRNLNLRSSILNPSHKKLDDKINSNHITNSSFTKVPNYEFEQLEKEIISDCYYSFLMKDKCNYLIYKTCGNKVEWERALMKNADEFRLLFPERKITTSDIYD